MDRPVTIRGAKDGWLAVVMPVVEERPAAVAAAAAAVVAPGPTAVATIPTAVAAV